MTPDEARAVLDVIEGADNQCVVCAAALAQALTWALPDVDWEAAVPDDGLAGRDRDEWIVWLRTGRRKGWPS